MVNFIPIQISSIHLIHFWAFSKSLGLLLWSVFHGLQCLPSLLCFSSHLGPCLLHNQQDTGYCELEQLKLAEIKERRRKKKKNWRGTTSLQHGSTYSIAQKTPDRLHFALTLPCLQEINSFQKLLFMLFSFWVEFVFLNPVGNTWTLHAVYFVPY